MKYIRSWLRLSSAERWLLLEATGWLGLARMGLLVIPFRRLAAFFGCHMAESSATVTPEQAATGRRVAWAVRVTSRHLPWECKCLVQALAARAMLRRRGISCTLYLGVTRGDVATLKAHAWLRSGTALLTGAHGREDYVVVSTFA